MIVSVINFNYNNDNITCKRTLKCMIASFIAFSDVPDSQARSRIFRLSLLNDCLRKGVAIGLDYNVGTNFLAFF